MTQAAVILLIVIELTVYRYLIAAQEEKIALSAQFQLVCDQSWVKFPSHFELMNVTRSFAINVDPRGLSEGAHYTEVH